MNKISAVFVLLIALTAGLAFPQSNVLKRGQYGIGLSGAYATSSGASGFTGTAGLGLGGIFDLAFTAGRAAYKSADFADLRGTSLVPELRAHVVKQNSSRSPVSVLIAIGYARDTFDSPDLDEAGLEMWATSLLVGAGISRDIPVSGKAFIQPTAGLGYTSSSFKIKDESTGLTFESSDEVVSFNIGVPFVYGFSERALFVLQPGLTLNQDTTTFSISAGLVLVLQ